MRRAVLIAACGAAAAASTLALAPPARSLHAPPGPAPTTLDRLVWSGRPLLCGGPGRRVFALTFDDGPSPWTRSLLRALRRGRAPGTFFLVGDRIGLWPDAVAAEARLGALGDHSWSHPVLTSLRPAQLRRQLVWTRAAILVRAETEVRLFRPPYDRTDAAVRRQVEALGLLDVRWNVDSGDSRPGARPAEVIRTVLAGLKPGAIVLLHDAHPWTGKVVRAVLAAARRRHLWPVTVPRLVAVDPPDPAHNCYA